jgi:hypothetical protein
VLAVQISATLAAIFIAGPQLLRGVQIAVQGFRHMARLIFSRGTPAHETRVSTARPDAIHCGGPRDRSVIKPG